MKWVRISTDTSAESEDALSNLLIEMGSGGVQVHNDHTSDGVMVSAYFPQDDIVGKRVSGIATFLQNMRELNINVGRGQISLDNLDERNWAERWKEFFKPLPIGKRILVAPSWENVSSLPPRDILIRIDPGMAFGVGGHSTTALALELLEDVLKGGEKVADVGTGSGILAIAAVKLGATKVVAIDADAKVVAVARENSHQNSVGDRIYVICGDRLGPVNDKYDIIVANISTREVSSMIPDSMSYLRTDGRLILSGILGRELPEIQDELKRNDLTVLRALKDKEWASVVARSPR